MAIALAIAPFVFLNGNHDPANLPQSAWVQAAGFAFAAWRLWRRTSPGASALDLPLAALIGWGLASVGWAHSRSEAIPVAVHWAGCGAWFVAVSRSGARPADARLLAVALFASGAAVAALGLAQHVLGFAVVYQAFPPAATFVHKNIAAQYVMATLPLGLAALAAWPRVIRVTPAAAACVVAAALMALFLAVTRTRSAWAAVAVESWSSRGSSCAKGVGASRGPGSSPWSCWRRRPARSPPRRAPGRVGSGCRGRREDGRPRRPSRASITARPSG